MVFGARKTCVTPSEKNASYCDYFKTSIKKLHLISEKARDNFIRSNERNKIHFDKKANPSEIKIGNKVLLRIDRSRKKLEPFYEGPFEVIDANLKSKNVTMKYKGKRYVFHLDQLGLAIIQFFNCSRCSLYCW